MVLIFCLLLIKFNLIIVRCCYIFFNCVQILTNFLSSVMIHATRPFVVNEWIQTTIEGYEVSGCVEVSIEILEASSPFRKNLILFL